MAAASVSKVEFRIAVAQRILNGESVSSLSRQYKIKRSLLYRWRDAYCEMGTAGFGRPRGPRPGAKRNAIAKPSTIADERIVELERRLGRMALENDFLRRAFKVSMLEEQTISSTFLSLPEIGRVRHHPAVYDDSNVDPTNSIDRFLPVHSNPFITGIILSSATVESLAS
jgi:transposase